MKIGRLVFTHGVGLRPIGGLAMPGYRVSVGRVASIDGDIVQLRVKNSDKLWSRSLSQVFTNKEAAVAYVNGLCRQTLDSFKSAFDPSVQPLTRPGFLVDYLSDRTKVR